MSLNYIKQLAYELSHRPQWLVLIETGLFIIIALSFLVGNSCVLYVFYKTSSLRNRGTTYYLMALAISDILMSLLVMPPNTLCCAYGGDVTGYNLGQAVGFVGFVLLYGSLQTTTLISINRFFCVVKPRLYRKYFTKKYILLSIGAVWVISLLFVGVFVVSGVASFVFHPGNMLYFLTAKDQTANRLFAAFSQISFGVIPLSITCVCYWKVHKAVEEHRKALSRNLDTNYLSKEEVHITKSVLALVCGFAVCWIPCSMVHHISVYANIPRQVQMVIPYTAYFSSAINPIVYNIFNKPFRRHFFQVFRRSHRVGDSTTQSSFGMNQMRETKS
ncbi:melatonin-related receptor-like [Exaiptasia diaphana]|uniref:G-protein coupled receptors family 1 profile domain-containing protein n=1 Tax=Exaiptasia diaphana TaxID=2652724 RepID=A0A913WQ38_EXADI|nr:melatonin-related receptor-like [Exaiptasia diaphana]